MDESGIYFIQGAQGLTRIAHFKHSQRRLSEMQIASPVPLRVVTKITQDEERIAVIERLHLQDTAADGIRPHDPLSLTSLAQIIRAHCASSHIRGEWYALNDLRLEGLKSIVLSPPSEQATQAVRNATTVWEAVRYAHQAASIGDHGGGNRWNAKVIEKHIIDWLAWKSQGNLSVLLEFIAQFSALSSTFNEVRTDDINYECFDTHSWMITQGEAIFSEMVSTPTLLGILQSVSSSYGCLEAYFALDAACKLLEGTRWDDHDALYWFHNRMAEGAHIEDFSGWDVSRLLAALDETERRSKG